MRVEKLNPDNAERYLKYLRVAFAEEPEQMTAEQVDEEGILKRVSDPFYARTESLLAYEGDQVVGRLEYHFYGCLQDGARMAYVDWVYVLKAYRHRGIAQGLFREFEAICRRNGIDQYYLIRSVKPEADRFYHGFKGAELSEEPLLRKEIKTGESL